MTFKAPSPSPQRVPDALSLAAGLFVDAVTMASSGLATPADIDTAMRLGAGHPVGPLELLGSLNPGTRDRAGLPDPTLSNSGRGPAGGAVAPDDWNHRVGIVGTGTMASGIVGALLRAGVATTVLARSAASAERLRGRVAGGLDKAVTKGRLDAGARDRTLDSLRLTLDLGDLGDCGHVIEAVAEQPDLKRQLLARLDRVLPARTVLATNTSSLTVGEVRAELPRRRTVIALHFFNPATAMKLVEVVAPDPAVADAACAWVRRIGKVPVRCGDERGFVVNRLLIPYLNDAVRQLDAGSVTPAEADALMRDALGHPMGPFELIDLIGTDVTLAAQTMLHEASGEARLQPADGLRRLVAEGRLGRKSGRGFHDHTATHRSAT
ncbi:3-hydroxyacyl-CoA dehydrogenase NAD-binding domain-containing protein [Streptomyces sp. NPDC004237]|uniref:3-hydroxyacyl-CoA dehydrogenase family protein n=1 Tax=Streptomyces sp. NPDC004237 TaxID=3154455 RepID=UPI0033A0151E